MSLIFGSKLGGIAKKNKLFMSQRKRGPLQLEEFVIGKSKAFKDKLGRLIEMVVINGALNQFVSQL